MATAEGFSLGFRWRKAVAGPPRRCSLQRACTCLEQLSTQQRFEARFSQLCHRGCGCHSVGQVLSSLRGFIAPERELPSHVSHMSARGIADGAPVWLRNKSSDRRVMIRTVALTLQV